MRFQPFTGGEPYFLTKPGSANINIFQMTAVQTKQSRYHVEQPQETADFFPLAKH